MRSKIALEWINRTNTITSVISGGYKRFRRLCLAIVKLNNISYKKELDTFLEDTLDLEKQNLLNGIIQ